MIKKILSIILLGILLSEPSTAVYLYENEAHPVFPEQYSNSYHLYPDIVNVYTETGHGTGCMISPNVVMTARHVVFDTLEKDGETKYSIRPSVSINLGDESYSVGRVVLYQTGTVDIALLILIENIKQQLKFREIRVVSENEEVILPVMVGFGRGRVINSKKYNPANGQDSYLDGSTLRFSQPGDFGVQIKRRLYPPGDESLTISLNGKYARLSSGDSGGPLLDSNGAIFGLCESSNKDFMQKEDLMIYRVQSEYNSALNLLKRSAPVLSTAILSGIIIRSLRYGCNISLLKSVVLGLSIVSGVGHLLKYGVGFYLPTTCRSVTDWWNYRIYSSIYAKHCLVRDQEISSAIESDEKRFASNCLSITPAMKSWIEKTISDNNV